MKLSKSLLMGALLAGAAATASAQVDVYIAGSTAYRGGVTRAICDLLSNNGANPINVTANSGSPFGASQALVSGTLNGTWYIVHTDWTGSAAGTSDVSTGRLLPFLSDTVATAYVASYSGTTGSFFTGYTTAATGTNLVATNIAMSDSFQASVAASLASASAHTSGVVTSSSAGSVFANAITAATLKPAGTLGEQTNDLVGLLPFVWVAGAQQTGTAPYTNMTQQNAADLIDHGYVPLANLGVAGDTADDVFLIGRNEDSGTRICAQAEAQANSYAGGYSFGQKMEQYYVTFTSGTASVQTDGSFPSDDKYVNGTGLGLIQDGGVGTTTNDFGLWPKDAPLNTQVYLNWDTLGHSGQIGGGDVAKVLSSSNILTMSGTSISSAGRPDGFVSGSSKAYLAGYLGIADATGVPGITAQLQTPGTTPTTGQGTLLTYNGVPYSAANVLNGQYTFWSYEHMYYATAGSNAIPAAQKTFADALADEIYTQDAQVDSSGNLDSTFPPASVKDGGILANGTVNFSKSAEGSIINLNY